MMTKKTHTERDKVEKRNDRTSRQKIESGGETSAVRTTTEKFTRILIKFYIFMRSLASQLAKNIGEMEEDVWCGVWRVLCVRRRNGITSTQQK